ncbi:hypothetical protein [Roseburia sp. 499]|uniref:hypothetical protein n=1 Tax=Roseburia sp. 499 TaxID=1261634 RepID=UPI002ED0EAF0|nr:hypothetical protein BIV20_12705 [Roseburia sp. 499]
MKRKILATLLATVLLFQGTATSVHAEGSGRTVPHYNITEVGGNWDGIHYTLPDGTLVTDAFFFDGTYTYYLQADGTPMRNKLTYHPDGEHIIYLDAYGHEVFGAFQYCQSVGYTCYFDSQGYLYKDQITFVGDKVYYLNANGAMEQSGWFQFANGRDYGYANGDGTLNAGKFFFDPWGRIIFCHWNGMVARGLITDGITYYSMDMTDGHLLGTFPVKSAVEMPIHNHNFVGITQRIWHAPEMYQSDMGHYETIVDEPAWDEEVTDFDQICLTCYYRDGSIIRLHGQAEVDQHCIYHYNTFGNGCQYGDKEFPTGEYIHHDAVTHQEWVSNIVTVTVKEAWDEVVTIGYQCSECGATK